MELRYLPCSGGAPISARRQSGMLQASDAGYSNRQQYPDLSELRPWCKNWNGYGYLSLFTGWSRRMHAGVRQNTEKTLVFYNFQSELSRKSLRSVINDDTEQANDACRCIRLSRSLNQPDGIDRCITTGRIERACRCIRTDRNRREATERIHWTEIKRERRRSDGAAPGRAADANAPPACCNQCECDEQTGDQRASLHTCCNGAPALTGARYAFR